MNVEGRKEKRKKNERTQVKEFIEKGRKERKKRKE